MIDANMVPDNGPNNPYLKAFWDWFPSVYPTLQTFRMTGGEPLMDKNTFKVFDYVLENPTNPDLHLSITSNCCPPGDQWSKFLKSLTALEDANAIDHFMLYCSLDSWGKQAEYIRNGLDFDVMYDNQIVASHRLEYYPASVTSPISVGGPNFIGSVVHVLVANTRLLPQEVAVLRAAYTDTTGCAPPPSPFPYTFSLPDFRSFCIPGFPCNPATTPPANAMKTWSSLYN
jgi:hypothetical protein